MKEMLNELLMADKTLIHVPFGNGFFDIYKSTVVSWIVLAVLIILIVALTSNLKVHNISKRQAAVESAVLWIRGVVGELLGEEAEFTFSAKDVKALKEKLSKNQIEENADEIKALLSEGEKIQAALKTTKKNLTNQEMLLHGKTERAYADLTEEKIKDLLEIKWIKGLCENLERQCSDVIDSLIEKLESLKKKYGITYESLQNDILETKKTLCGLMYELEASEFDKKGLEEFQKILRG